MKYKLHVALEAGPQKLTYEAEADSSHEIGLFVRAWQRVAGDLSNLAFGMDSLLNAVEDLKAEDARTYRAEPIKPKAVGGTGSAPP